MKLLYALALFLLVVVSNAFIPSTSFRSRLSPLVVSKASAEELYEAASACIDGECPVDLVDDLKMKLGSRKKLLMEELSKVSSLADDLKGEKKKEADELTKTLRAIYLLFSPPEDTGFPHGVMKPQAFTDDVPSKDKKDYWDYDLAWKNYYAKIQQQVEQ